MNDNVNDHLQNEDDIENIEIRLLLEGMFMRYGYDFRNYKSSFIRRRIQNIMREENLSDMAALQAKVLRNPHAMERVLDNLAINVTEMFRDPSFFLAFRTKVIPVLRDLPYIRIWLAGCSSGEEAYSIAILLQEEGLYQKTRIYATDIAEKLLVQAKQGIFPIDRMKIYTKNYLQAGGTKAFSEYYTAKLDYVTFHPFLMENVVFAQHNLVTDGSFNEFHVIFCRNVMIYFDKFLQDNVHKLLYDSLSLSGFLCLGDREGIKFTKFGECYEEISQKEKIFHKIK